jgi:hypothetical protein
MEMGKRTLEVARIGWEEREEKLFTGRKAELERMRHIVENDEWRLLYISGLSGLGKTQLLRQFCRIATEWPIWQLEPVGRNGRDRGIDSVQIRRISAGIGAPDEPWEQIVPLAALPEQVQKCGDGAARAVLLFDPFEQWEPVHHWLKEQLFPKLPNPVRAIAASRLPPGEVWTRDARWNRLTEHLALEPFDQVASFQLIANHGITQFETQYYLAKLARGFPYALQQLCHDALQHGDQYMASPFYLRSFYERMTRYLQEGLALGDLELQMLDAASLLWNFDQDGISCLIGQEVPVSIFRGFCQLPLIEPALHGWRIAPFAKRWFRKEFSNRSPKRYAEMRKLAKAFVLGQIREASPLERRMWFVNLLHLAENDSLHTLCFLDSPDLFVIEPLRKADLAQAGDMFVSFHEQVPAFFRDQTHQELYLEEYYRLTPETFYGFYRDGRLAMFMSMLPLVPEVAESLRRNPVYRAYIEQGDHEEQDTLMWIASFLPEYSLSAIGRVFLHGFSQLAGKGRLIVLSPFPEAHHLNESLSFERLEWADYTTDHGLKYQAYRLDLRDTAALEIAIDGGFAAMRTGKEPLLTKESAFALVKQILNRFDDFEQQDDIVAQCPYLSQFAHSSLERAEAAAVVRQFLSGIMAEWLEQGGTYRTYGRILQACYVQKLGTHEKIAARLNMSISNYYRSLKKAVQQLGEVYRIRFHP